MFQKGNKFGKGRPHKSKLQKSVEDRCRQFMEKGGWKIIWQKAKRGDEWALNKVVSYAYGMPIERNKIEIPGLENGGLICLLARSGMKAVTQEVQEAIEEPKPPLLTENVT